MKKKNNRYLTVVGVLKSMLIVAAILTGIGVLQSCTNDDAGNSAAKEQSSTQKYTCGMHPQIIQDEPGNCPICGMKLTPLKASTAENSSSSASGEKKVLYYKDPMHPWYTSDEPGKAPDCGMDLVPVYEGETGSAGVIRIDPAVEQNINVKIDEVKKTTMHNIIHTSGHIGIAEPGQSIINTKIGGWVENLYVDYVGQSVRRGQKLLDIYSPELVAAEEELLTAVDYQNNVSKSSNPDVMNSGSTLLKNVRRKLELWDISEKQIDEIIRTREVSRVLTLYAKSNGVVMEKNIIEGEHVLPGKPLLEIADLSSVWVHADLYDFELSQVQVGQKAIMRPANLPNKEYNGRVSFIYPTLDPKTRTGKIRMQFSNPGNELKPEMYTDVEILTDPIKDALVIPEQAVIRSGRKNVVIVALGDGRFEPRTVEAGIVSDGYVHIKSGLEEGEHIVTSSQFLIDSESNLRAALNQMTSEKHTETSKNQRNESTSPQKHVH